MRLLTIGLLGALCAMAACATDTESDGGAGGTTNDKLSLPCGVAEVVERHCAQCHGAPVRSGAPQPLSMADQWRIPSTTDPAQSNGELSVARMQDAINPMPPAGLITPEEISVVADWVAAGMPGGDCTPATPDDPALDALPICNSMDMWPAPQHHALGKTDEEMFPGMPCIDCHANPANYGQPEPGPPYDLAGTVYPSAHEPDNCAGLDGLAATDVVVHIEDANGGVWDLQPNTAGNFLLEPSGLVPPYSARVISSRGVRAMSLKPTSGDCNLCHTENGSSGPEPDGPVAPGRIVIP